MIGFLPCPLPVKKYLAPKAMETTNAKPQAKKERAINKNEKQMTEICQAIDNIKDVTH
jgi:hypothetical protein